MIKLPKHGAKSNNMGHLQLENSWLSIRVNLLGAELQSLRSRPLDREYLWQPDDMLWDRQALLLFPNVGRVAGGYAIIGGKEYPQQMHGFAKDLVFTLIEQDENHLLLALTESEKTRESFPFSFRMEVEYILQEDSLLQVVRVRNTDTIPFWFAVGVHPGFICPIFSTDKAEDYFLRFSVPQTLTYYPRDEESGLCTGETRSFAIRAEEIPLHDHFFDGGAFITGSYTTDTIWLCHRTLDHFVELRFENFSYMVIWGPPERLHFVCLEPWSGLPDFVGTDHIWEKKPGNIRLNPGDTYTGSLWFRVG